MSLSMIDWEMAPSRPGGAGSTRTFGLAVDVGTTTIALFLVEVETEKSWLPGELQPAGTLWG